MRKISMNKKILTATLFLILFLTLTGCLDTFEEEKKVERVLLKGSPSEENYQQSQKYFLEGNYSEALKYDEKQLEEDLRYFKEQSAEIAVDYNNIGLDYDNLKEYNKALEYYKKAMKIDEIVLPQNSIERATTYYNIASSYASLEEYNLSLDYFHKTLKIDIYEENVVASYQEMGTIYEKTKNYKRSFHYYTKALKLQEKLYPKEDEKIFTTKSKLRELGKHLK